MLAELDSLTAFGVALVETLWQSLATALKGERIARGVRLLIALQLLVQGALRLTEPERAAEQARCTAAAARADDRRDALDDLRCDVNHLRGVLPDGREWEGLGTALPPGRTVSAIARTICREFGITPDMPQWPATLLDIAIAVRDLRWTCRLQATTVPLAGGGERGFCSEIALNSPRFPAPQEPDDVRAAPVGAYGDRRRPGSG